MLRDDDVAGMHMRHPGILPFTAHHSAGSCWPTLRRPMIDAGAIGQGFFGAADSRFVDSASSEHSVLADGRYELMVRHEDSAFGEVWSANDSVLNRPVQVVICPETTDGDVAHLEAQLNLIEAHPASGMVQPFIGTVRDEQCCAFIFAAPEGVSIEAAVRTQPETTFTSLVGAFESVELMVSEGLPSPSLAARDVRVHDDRIVCEHPFVSASSAEPPSDDELLDSVRACIDHVLDPSSNALVVRRVQRAFPMLMGEIEALRAGSFATLAEAAQSLREAVDVATPAVLVVGGGPLVLQSSGASVQNTEVHSPKPRLELVDEMSFDVIDPDEVRSRYRLPSSTVIVAVSVALVLLVVLIGALQSARQVGTTTNGRMPGNDMRHVIASMSASQGAVTTQLGAYHSQRPELAQLRAAGAELEHDADAAETRMRKIKPTSQPEAELRQSALSLLSAQQSLGRDIRQLAPNPAKVTSIDGQVVMLSSQAVAKQFVSTAIVLRSAGQKAVNADDYTRLPVNGKVFLDAVMELEWKRQSDQLAARYRAQEKQLRLRITAAEKAFRDKMISAAYQAWYKQFSTIRGRAYAEIARGRGLARSGGCDLGPLQQSLGTRGYLMFVLNTLAPPNQQSLNQQIALQKDLAASVAGDFGALMAGAPKKVLSGCAG